MQLTWLYLHSLLCGSSLHLRASPRPAAAQVRPCSSSCMQVLQYLMVLCMELQGFCGQPCTNIRPDAACLAASSTPCACMTLHSLYSSVFCITCNATASTVARTSSRVWPCSVRADGFSELLCCFGQPQRCSAVSLSAESHVNVAGVACFFNQVAKSSSVFAFVLEETVLAESART